MNVSIHSFVQGKNIRYTFLDNFVVFYFFFAIFCMFLRIFCMRFWCYFFQFKVVSVLFLQLWYWLHLWVCNHNSYQNTEWPGLVSLLQWSVESTMSHCRPHRITQPCIWGTEYWQFKCLVWILSYFWDISAIDNAIFNANTADQYLAIVEACLANSDEYDNFLR